MGYGGKGGGGGLGMDTVRPVVVGRGRNGNRLAGVTRVHYGERGVRYLLQELPQRRRGLAVSIGRLSPLVHSHVQHDSTTYSLQQKREM